MNFLDKEFCYSTFSKAQTAVLKNEIEYIIKNLKRFHDTKNIMAHLLSYIKAAIKIQDMVEDKVFYDDETDNSLNTMYSALVQKNTNSLGVSKAVKYILQKLGINCTIALFIKENIVIYLCIANIDNYTIKIDAVTELLCDRNFISYDEFYSKGKTILLSDEYFEDEQMDFFDLSSINHKLTEIGLN